MRRPVRRVLARFVLVTLVLGSSIAWMPGLLPPAAQAFYPTEVHIPKFESELGSNFDALGRQSVIAGLKQADFTGQDHHEWHFDNALDPKQICALWTKGPGTLLDQAANSAVEAFRPGSTGSQGVDRVAEFRGDALAKYGLYLHAIQDFYAHTNWIEIQIATNQPFTVAPIQSGCNFSDLPKDLQSGYFVDDEAFFPDFCGPPSAPRPPVGSGFMKCHGPPTPNTIDQLRNAKVSARWLSGFRTGSLTTSPPLPPSTLPVSSMLAKDVECCYHGAETIPGSSLTYFHVAVDLATEATRETWPVFHDRVAAKLKKELKDRDPECLFQVLVKGGDPACPRRVVPGGHFQGDVVEADAQVAALLTNPPGDFTELHDLHVAIDLDPTTHAVLGGSLSYEAFNPAARHVYAADTAAGIGPFQVLPGGILGRMVFHGVITVYYADGSVFVGPLEEDQVFTYASDPAGRVGVCANDNSWDQLQKELETQRQECMARALIELQPSGSAPPIA